MSTKVKASDQFVVTGFEAPIHVRNPKGGKELTYVEGDKLKAGDWPNFHLTIPNAVANGLISAVEGSK